jgi:type II secretory pathway pseudopilin PulG
MRKPKPIIVLERLDAFTLVEVLLAMAVASLLMVTLLSILSKSMDVSKRANAGMLSKSSAQAALDVMETDLASLLVSRNAGQVFCYTNTNTAVGSTTITNAVIYCLTTSMLDSYSTNNTGNPGVPRLVQYVIQYAANFASSSKSYSLYRNVLDPTNTFTSFIGTNDLTGVNNSSAWTNTNSPLVPNVVGMTCTLYTNYGAGIWSNSSGGTNYMISSTNFPSGVVVEISLTVLDESGLSRFTNASASGNNSPTNLILQYGRTLVRRISLPSPP